VKDTVKPWFSAIAQLVQFARVVAGRIKQCDVIIVKVQVGRYPLSIGSFSTQRWLVELQIDKHLPPPHGSWLDPPLNRRFKRQTECNKTTEAYHCLGNGLRVFMLKPPSLLSV